MPPRVKAAAAPSIDDSRDDLMATPAPIRKPTAKMPAKTRQTATRRASVSKATTTTTSKTKRKAAPKQSREALKDRTNLQDGNETEEVDEFENEDVDDATTKPAAKRAKTTAAARKNAKANTNKKSTTGTKQGRTAKRVPTPEPLDTIPETQPDPDVVDDVEPSIEIDEDTMDIEKAPTPQPILRQGQRAPSVPVQPLQPRPSARAVSAQPIFPPVRSRSGSATGFERRGGDPELRRQLNEISKKYENLQLKYDSLQEIGKGAESNFEDLKRASDQKAKDAADLIASLRKELAEMRKASTSNTSTTTDIQTQISTLTTSNDKLTTERDDLREKNRTSTNEIKSLEAKLIAARQQISNSAQEAKAQELAAKKNGPISANLADTQKEAKMKENLYADLTGLIISSIKRVEGEDIYNCIQTGRNGTLQFHLSISHDSATPHPKTPSGMSYEETEFAYEPLLDESRDKALLDLLPDYLTEEIFFPRNHAQRFYLKVVESMTKKIVVEQSDEE